MRPCARTGYRAGAAAFRLAPAPVMPCRGPRPAPWAMRLRRAGRSGHAPAGPRVPPRASVPPRPQGGANTSRPCRERVVRGCGKSGESRFVNDFGRLRKRLTDTLLPLPACAGRTPPHAGPSGGTPRRVPEPGERPPAVPPSGSRRAGPAMRPVRPVSGLFSLSRGSGASAGRKSPTGAFSGAWARVAPPPDESARREPARSSEPPRRL